MTYETKRGRGTIAVEVQPDDSIAARVVDGPAAALAAAFEVLDTVSAGSVPGSDLLVGRAPDREALGRLLVEPLSSKDPSVVLATLSVLKVAGADGPEVRRKLSALVRSRNEAVRLSAAEALGDDRSRAISLAPDVLRDLRSEDAGTRVRAAQRVRHLKLDEPAVAAALVRVVESGDFAAREGLVLGLERAYEFDSRTVDVLRGLADSSQDGRIRAYVRAALREIRAAEGAGQ